MRAGPAFRFVGELLNDYQHIVELSDNPIMLYMETGIKTLKTASKVFEYVEAKANTKTKKILLENLQSTYENLKEIQHLHDYEMLVASYELEYEHVKQELRDGDFNSKMARSLIRSLGDEVSKLKNILENTPVEKSDVTFDVVVELYRKASRNYQMSINTYLEGDNTNG